MNQTERRNYQYDNVIEEVKKNQEIRPISSRLVTTCGQRVDERVAMLTDSGIEIIAFVGPPGAGKTANYNELIEQFSKSYQIFGFRYENSYHQVRKGRDKELTDQERATVDQKTIFEMKAIIHDLKKRDSHKPGLIFYEAAIFGKANRGNGVLQWLSENHLDKVHVLGFFPDKDLLEMVSQFRSDLREYFKKGLSKDEIILQIKKKGYPILLSKDQDFNILEQKIMEMASSEELKECHEESMKLMFHLTDPYSKEPTIKSSQFYPKKAKTRQIKLRRETFEGPAAQHALTAMQDIDFTQKDHQAMNYYIGWICLAYTYLEALGYTVDTEKYTPGKPITQGTNASLVFNQLIKEKKLLYKLDS